jgi:integrase/recombinase XerD
MQPTDFSKYLTSFLTKYLSHERGASSNTIASYRDTFVLLITFLETKNIKLNKLTLEQITKDTVVEFLNWVQSERKNTNATRNARLSAIHSFYKYLQYQHPENLYAYQEILSIRMKKAEQIHMNYLSIEGITLLLRQPDVTTSKGRRDLALLSLMYDTASRVQELIDLTPSSIRLDNLSTIRVTGKGKKTRIIPMQEKQVKLLKNYIHEHQLTEPEANMYPLFYNGRREKLTRAAVNHILHKYAGMARIKNPKIIPERISCHSLRHSKAMHLLQAGVNLVYLRDILGHVSVQTTEVYARADSKKRKEKL